MIYKYLRIFLISIFLIVICMSNCSYAIPGVPQEEYQYKSPIEPGDLTGTGGNVDDIEKAGSAILSIVSIIGSGISIIAIIALGIKYMLGSVEEKAEYKKTLVPYLIGAICVFGATTIPSIVYKMFN